jgi:alpha-1,2-mannosyltransferase
MTNATVSAAPIAAGPPDCPVGRAPRAWAAPVSYATLAVMVGVIVWYSATHGLYDLSVYVAGGHAVSQDAGLYLHRVSLNWFSYSPFAAVLFASLGGLPAALARVCWELGSVAALGTAMMISLKLAGLRVTRPMLAAAVAVSLTLEPVYHTLYLGQINLFLFAAILADIWLISRGRHAGVGVGIAAAIKLTPAIFVVLFLLTRRVRSALIAVATFAGCTLMAWLIAPGASKLYWLHMFYDARRLGVEYVSNQSLYATVVRLSGGASHVGSWWYVLPLVFGIGGLLVARTLALHKDWLGAAAVTGTTGLLVSPISWTHHWVWIIPALIVLARGGVRSRIAAGCAYLLFVAAPMWFTPWWGGPRQYGWHGPETIIANCFMLSGVAFLAYMARRAWLVSRPAAPLTVQDVLGAIPQEAR